MTITLLEWWDSWQFAQAIWFYALLLWPLIHWLTARANKANNSRDAGAVDMNAAIFRHPRFATFFNATSDHNKQNSSRSTSSFWPVWIARLLSAAILLSLVTALAQPQRQLEKKPVENTPPQRDIALVLESSVSFVLEDYKLHGQPASRMTVVKTVLDQFVESLRANRFSLALYAEQAYTLVPMTADSEVLRMSLQRLQPYLAGRTDEAMGEALGLALRELRALLDATQMSEYKRILVLVSDGSQKTSRIALADIVAYAQSLSVPIYTIGIGAASEQADQRTLSGLIYQPLESQSLQFLAQQTGGRYFQVGGSEDLAAVLREIEQLEGTINQQSKQTRWHNESLYHAPLFSAVMLFGLWWIWTAGGRRWNS